MPARFSVPLSFGRYVSSVWGFCWAMAMFWVSLPPRSEQCLRTGLTRRAPRGAGIAAIGPQPAKEGVNHSTEGCESPPAASRPQHGGISPSRPRPSLPAPAAPGPAGSCAARGTFPELRPHRLAASLPGFASSGLGAHGSAFLLYRAWRGSKCFCTSGSCG